MYFSTEEIDLADRHTRTVQAWLSSRSPEARAFHGRVVQARSTGLPIRFLNLALGENCADTLPDDLILKEIEQVKSFFATRQLPWYWLAGSHHGARMPSLLERCGLTTTRPPLPSLATRLSSWQVLEIDDSLAVWQANGRVDLEAASKIRHTALSFPKGFGEDYFEAMAQDWLAGNPAKLYLAGVKNGPPAAVGALIMGDGIPGVYVMATLPDWRRKGLGKAIVNKVMQDAKTEGHDLIALTASPVGKPLYEQFGFQQIFHYHMYQFDSA